ncbi:MAG: hypothetical protein ACC634_06805 [Hyphomicrobiales bacterium]
MNTASSKAGFWGTFRSYLVAGTVLSVLAGVLGLVPALMSPMMFDTPGSQELISIWLLFGLIGAFPLVCFLGPGASYLAYRAVRHGWAVALLASPLYVLALTMLLYFVLKYWCGEQFACS